MFCLFFCRHGRAGAHQPASQRHPPPRSSFPLLVTLPHGVCVCHVTCVWATAQIFLSRAPSGLPCSQFDSRLSEQGVLAHTRRARAHTHTRTPSYMQPLSRNLKARRRSGEAGRAGLGDREEKHENKGKRGLRMRRQAPDQELEGADAVQIGKSLHRRTYAHKPTHTYKHQHVHNERGIEQVCARGGHPRPETIFFSFLRGRREWR